MTDLKGLQDQVVEDTARQFGMPLAKDITGLYERLHSIEQTILDRLRPSRNGSRPSNPSLEMDRPVSSPCFRSESMT